MKDAAICVTAKIRSRRPVPPVMRALPLAWLNPFELSAEGSRGINANKTAATSASSAPTHNMLESTVRSSARTENREAYRDRIATIGRALITPSNAPAPHNKRLSASSTRRNDAVLAPSAARIDSSPSRRTVRARIKLATFEHAIINTNPDAASSTHKIVLALDVTCSRSFTAPMLEVRLFRIRLRILPLSSPL